MVTLTSILARLGNALIVMAVVVIGYFVLVVRLSDKEYREVISERFAGKP